MLVKPWLNDLAKLLNGILSGNDVWLIVLYETKNYTVVSYKRINYTERCSSSH